MYALNSALIQMTLRRLLLNSDSKFQAVLAEQRIGVKDLMWMQLLNRKKLEALDKLPVSLFRVHYRTMDVGRSGLDDDIFETVCISLSMVMETIAFAITNKSNSLVSIGFDMEGFDRFRAEPFLRRLMLIHKGGFSLGTRCDLGSLELKADDKDSLLRDCIRIILGDYRFLSSNRPKHVGRIRDWNLEMMGAEVVATNLLMVGVKPKLVVAHIGLPEKVDSIYRKLRREHVVMPKGGGRIGTHTGAIERQPFHAILFLAIYLLLANQPMSRINCFAYTRALHEYRLICDYLGIEGDTMLDATDCWLLASGYRAQDVVLEECRSCKQYTIVDMRKNHSCLWCK